MCCGRYSRSRLQALKRRQTLTNSYIVTLRTLDTRRHEADGAGGTFAGSPPAHDDSFFYIRYPIGKDGGGRKAPAGAAGQIQTLTETLSEVQVTKPAAAVAGHQVPAENVRPQQFAKHTEPCKMFMTATSESEYNWL